MRYRHVLAISLGCLLATHSAAGETAAVPVATATSPPATSPEAMRRKGLVLRGNRWILREEAALIDRGRSATARDREMGRKVRGLLGLYAQSGERTRRFAEEALRAVDDVHKLGPFTSALRSPKRHLRLFAARELGRIGERAALRPLLHHSVYDRSAEVRHAAIAAAVEIGDEDLIAPLVRALGSANAATRANAADAIGRAGDPRGVRYLVYRFEAHGGGAPRTYVFAGGQTSYVRDFDVEVA